MLLSYDLASGQGTEHDYFACVLFAIDEANRKVYVCDASHSKIPFPDQVETIKYHAKMNNADVLIETVGYQQSIVQYLNIHEPWLNVFSFKPKVNKRMRLEQVTPHMTNGRVLFCDMLDPTNIKKPEQGDLIEELLDFPIGKHDDLVDAFSQGMIWIGERFLAAEESNDGRSEVIILGD